MFSWESVCSSACPALMGVVNVTPDSFSDGGRFADADAAIAHGRRLADAGADILDVGGESTRPGAEPTSATEEIARVRDVVAGLVEANEVVSIDTTKAAVADVALALGARVVNDVSGGEADPDMLDVVADRGAGYVVMHMQGEPRTMQNDPTYDDVVGEVGAYLAARVAATGDAGIPQAAVLADPGIGFGKMLDHNLALLGALPQLARAAGVGLLIGASRKRFLAAILERAGFVAPPPDERDDLTVPTVVWCATRNVRVLRVHDVAGAAGALVAAGRRAA